MKFLLNELSIHNQFADSHIFISSLKQILGIRRILQEAGHHLHCTNRLLTRPTYEDVQVNTVLIQPNFRELGLRVRIWLSKEGPFWDTPSEHDFKKDYFTLADDDDFLVTKSALAEAAFLAADNQLCSTISFSPSDFCFSSLSIAWHRETVMPVFDIQNLWEAQPVRTLLRHLPIAITSWDGMLEIARQRFQFLSFVENILEYLDGVPFRQATAKRSLELLAILNELQQCFDGNGKRTREGHEIIKNHFQGNSARFSDESLKNKHSFEREMTFDLLGGRSVFCPFHGKIGTETGPMRIHFTWPVTADSSLYIVYIGPKITKS
ncbi:hypothetical protein MNBD_CHLOROFLEXI01-955 [hydrothermal vent metagenome]|uniref:Uncharacterized protein n=1 Tax=hydrothermal vent metagenome TaxID=652676 RepID=A0A3B0VL19_9ZZZZ